MKEKMFQNIEENKRKISVFVRYIAILHGRKSIAINGELIRSQRNSKVHIYDECKRCKCQFIRRAQAHPAIF